jgi:hypothetical protein
MSTDQTSRDARIPPLFTLFCALAWFNDGKLDSDELKKLLVFLEALTGEDQPEARFLAKHWLIEILEALNATRLELMENRKPRRKKAPEYMRFEDAVEIVDTIAGQCAEPPFNRKLDESFDLLSRFVAGNKTTANSRRLLKRIQTQWNIKH